MSDEEKLITAGSIIVISTCTTLVDLDDNGTGKNLKKKPQQSTLKSCLKNTEKRPAGGH